MRRGRSERAGDLKACNIMCGAGAHLTCLLLSCTLHSLALTAKSTYIPRFHTFPPLLSPCTEVPDNPPPISLLPHPVLRIWSHPYVTFLSTTSYSKKATKHFLVAIPSPLCIFLHSDPSFSHPYLIYFKITRNHKTILSDFCLHTSPILSALSSTIQCLPPSTSDVLLFYDRPALPVAL